MIGDVLISNFAVDLKEGHLNTIGCVSDLKQETYINCVRTISDHTVKKIINDTAKREPDQTKM